MDWSNEAYARLYIRDTKTWILLGWEGQCVLCLLLRKLDRAGVLADVFDAADLALVLSNGMPVDLVSTGLDRLMRREVVEISDVGIVMPNYLLAQEANASDAQRKREERERRRDKSRAVVEPVTKRDASVTKRDASVTKRDFLSRDLDTSKNTDVSVTLCSLSSAVLPDQISSGGGRSKDLTGTQREDASLPPPPPPSTARVRSETRPTNAEAQPVQGVANATGGAHSEPPRSHPPSEPKCVPLASRRVRATDDLMGCPVGELAKRCRLNQYDASMAPLGERPELVRVSEAWAQAVGVRPRPLGTYGDRNKPLLALLEAFEVATEEELLAVCEAAARDDWCTGRKGSERDPARKRDLGCLTQTVLRRLLDAVEERRPKFVNPRVAAFLAEEKRREAAR